MRRFRYPPASARSSGVVGLSLPAFMNQAKVSASDTSKGRIEYPSSRFAFSEETKV